ncbi:transmembrane protein, putative (macronuclear) [Tetrahymena thermophila SB210]|uniref:Transmembrane protein, putative n=1 Tax=Tetrahymena thermophila (strain SB210) TaxID=312017 RepID=I7M3I5_TETTS|nr:transmembrane protein, putative [Tetrahymena thermophila SB210]EAS03213.1 transmembrane protein, putative [Tetrahymena thermophila SB210]|eukprot:XP_001023458.1 transmembrane protein, putative [Tetrahymena thermophila SB210]
MKRILLVILVVQLFLTFNCQEHKVQYERIIRKNEYVYEQNSQTEFDIEYPGLVRGIYNYSIMQRNFQKNDPNQASYDEICNLVTDSVSQLVDQLNHITLNELTDSQNDKIDIINFAHHDFNNDKTVYIITSDKNVLQVKLDQNQFKLTGQSNFTQFHPDNINKLRIPRVASNNISKRIYIASSTFIISKPIDEQDKFSETPFVLEKNYQNCSKVEEVLSLNEYLIIACYESGLNIYKIGENKELIYVKSYSPKDSVYKVQYNEQYKLLAFLKDFGIYFIPYINGEFGEIQQFMIASLNSNNFVSNDFETFWLFGNLENHVLEVFVDIENKIQQVNLSHINVKSRTVGSYLNDVYGIIFYEDHFSIFIHSIPSDQVSGQREEIANFTLEDTKKFLVIEDKINKDQAFVFSTTEKSLKLNVIQFNPPRFSCKPREETGLYEYRLRIFSQECDQDESKQLFYQCVVQDSIDVKVMKSYVTSSQQKLIICIGVGIAVFFILIIAILIFCYKRKKIDLDKIEEKVRNLRKIKYQNLEKENQSV